MTGQPDLFEEAPASVPEPVAKLAHPNRAKVPEFVRRADEARGAQAAARGLTAKWSREFGFVSLHDPNSGEWHDVPGSSAPAWAKREAGTRKRLYRAGRRDAYDLTRAEMEEIWVAEHAPARDWEPDFIQEE
jgi:hypothetical protein